MISAVSSFRRKSAAPSASARATRSKSTPKTTVKSFLRNTPPWVTCPSLPYWFEKANNKSTPRKQNSFRGVLFSGFYQTTIAGMGKRIDFDFGLYYDDRVVNFVAIWWYFERTEICKEKPCFLYRCIGSGYLLLSCPARSNVSGLFWLENPFLSVFNIGGHLCAAKH